jgi:hypothetical protein
MPNDTALLFRVLAFGLGSNGTATMRPVPRGRRVGKVYP